MFCSNWPAAPACFTAQLKGASLAPRRDPCTCLLLRWRAKSLWWRCWGLALVKDLTTLLLLHWQIWGRECSPNHVAKRGLSPPHRHPREVPVAQVEPWLGMSHHQGHPITQERLKLMAPKHRVSFSLFLASLKLLDRIKSTHQFYYSEFGNYYFRFVFLFFCGFFAWKGKCFSSGEKRKGSLEKKSSPMHISRILILFNLVWKSVWAAEMQIIFTYDTIWELAVAKHSSCMNRYMLL